MACEALTASGRYVFCSPISVCKHSSLTESHTFIRLSIEEDGATPSLFDRRSVPLLVTSAGYCSVF